MFERVDHRFPVGEFHYQARTGRNAGNGPHQAVLLTVPQNGERGAQRDHSKLRLGKMIVIKPHQLVVDFHRRHL